MLAEGFCFSDDFYLTEQFMRDTKTSAMLVIKDDVIKYEEYFFGGGESIYVNPSNRVIIVKVNADPDFMSENYELKHIEFFRTIAAELS